MRSKVHSSIALLAGALVCSAAVPAHAILNGETASASWAVALSVSSGKKDSGICSGSLIAPEWVLTAAHCVATLHDDDENYSVVEPKTVTAHVGRGSEKEKGEKFKVDRIEVQRYRNLDDPPERRDDDVALLHLTKPSAAQPLLLMPGRGELVRDGMLVRAYGYGWTTVEADGPIGELHRTKAGANHLLTGCSAATDGMVCAEPVDAGSERSGALDGDSGGPWVTEVDGRPVGVFVISGMSGSDSDGRRFEYGESVYNPSTAAWIRGLAGIPSPAPGNLIRDPATAESWLIDQDGFRRAVPDGSVFTCLTESGSVSSNAPREVLDLIPLRAVPAECTPAPASLPGTPVRLSVTPTGGDTTARSDAARTSDDGRIAVHLTHEPAWGGTSNAPVVLMTDVASGTRRALPTPAGNAAPTLAVSGDGTTVAMVGDHGATFVDTRSLATSTTAAIAYSSVAELSYDGRYLATEHASHPVVYDRTDDRVVSTVLAPPDVLHGYLRLQAMSSDGRYVHVTDPWFQRLWRYDRSTAVLHEFTPLSADTSPTQYSDDGRRAAVVHADGHALVRDIDSQVTSRVDTPAFPHVTGYQRGYHPAWISNDGQRLLYASPRMAADEDYNATSLQTFDRVSGRSVIVDTADDERRPVPAGDLRFVTYGKRLPHGIYTMPNQYWAPLQIE